MTLPASSQKCDSYSLYRDRKYLLCMARFDLLTCRIFGAAYVIWFSFATVLAQEQPAVMLRISSQLVVGDTTI